MLAKTAWIGAFLALSAACATEPTDDPDGNYDADPSDFDTKADGVSGSSAAVLSFIDGATQRLFVQAPTLADKALLKHLTTAAQRGVDVHVYVVVPHPAHPATVLAAEGLEAAGVDTVVDRKSQLPAGFLAVADDAMLVGSPPKVVKTASAVGKAADQFAAAIAEDTSGTVPALGSDQTALMIMPDSHAGPIVGLIDGAATSIDLEIYQLQSPAVAAALEAAEQRGVTVRVMLEPRTVGAANFKAMQTRLTAAKIAVQATPPDFDSHHNVDHAKFMLIDGHELVFGSGNMVRSGLGGNRAEEFDNRDFWIRDRRAAAISEAKTVFAADWAHTSTSSTTFTTLVLTPDNADEAILAHIDAAHDRLYVYNQSLKDDTLIAHLTDAKARGVDVRVLLGMQPGFGGAPAANQAALDTLTAAKIPAGFFTTHYLHGKVIVADHAVFIGSQNFTSGGLGNNRELGEILAGPEIVDALGKLFIVDQASPAP